MRGANSKSRGLNYSMAVAVWVYAAAAWAQTPAAGSVQAYPIKPVRYVVPFAAGTGNDIVGRLIADRLTRMWGVLLSSGSSISRQRFLRGPPSSATRTRRPSTPGRTSRPPSPRGGRGRCTAARRPARTTSRPQAAPRRDASPFMPSLTRVFAYAAVSRLRTASACCSAVPTSPVAIRGLQAWTTTSTSWVVRSNSAAPTC